MTFSTNTMKENKFTVLLKAFPQEMKLVGGGKKHSLNLTKHIINTPARFIVHQQIAGQSLMKS